MTSRHVAVIGAGISGLVAAHRLQQQGHRVTVFEASDRPGGKIRSGRLGDVMVEEGADAFLPRDDAPVELCRELGLDQDLVTPEVFGAFVWLDGALRKVPAGSPYGIPSSPFEAHRAGLLSRQGAARARAEVLWPRPLRGADVSVADFVTRRFGREVLANLVDPLLRGVRGGRAKQMSLAAAAREIDSIARSNRSVLRTLSREGAPEQPRFLAPAGGLQRMTVALVERLQTLRLETVVDELVLGATGVTLVSRGQREAFDGVLLAVPSHAAAVLLDRANPVAARRLRTITYASLAVVALAYPSGAFRAPPGGSGFLVPSHAGLTIAACTWYSEKWRHARAADREIVRCVVGWADDDPNLALDDERLTSAVHSDLAVTLGVTAAPMETRVTRWDHSIPQYRVGHLDLVAEVEALLERAGPIAVTGAAYRGSGIPDCISQANRATSRLSARLARAPG